MKSVAIAGLALVGGVAARSTIHYDRHPSDPRTTFARPQPAQTILTAHDDEFGIVDVKTDIQTVVMPGNRGRVTIGRDDADNELDMHFNVPNNRGNFQVNDYTKTHDDFDDEFGIVDVKTDIQTVVMPGNRGRVTIGRDDADDEFYDFLKSKYQPMGISKEVERRREMMVKPEFRRDDADNELDMHFNVPNNRGNFQVNDYTKTHDDFDDEFGIVNVKTDLETVVMPGNSGPVTIRRDDADNELDMHFNVPNNRGNFQVNDYTKTQDDELHMHFTVPNNRGNFEVNDYTVRKDAEDDEFGIVDVKTDIQTVVMPGNRGRVTIGRDDADNELGFRGQDFVMGTSGEFARHRRDYLTNAHDDEFGIVNVKTDLQTVVMPGNSGPVTIRRDDADNELDMHFNVPNNRGNFQVNDYTKTHDDEELFLHLDIKSDIQTVVMPSNKGHVSIKRDDADNELDMHFNVPNNRGNFVVNDYTVKKDAEDDEFGVADYDDEFAVSSKHLNKDEIDLLASILKRATQDKEGNVIIDGVKIAKIPQKVEVPKPKKFLAL